MQIRGSFATLFSPREPGPELSRERDVTGDLIDKQNRRASPPGRLLAPS